MYLTAYNQLCTKSSLVGILLVNLLPAVECLLADANLEADHGHRVPSAARLRPKATCNGSYRAFFMGRSSLSS